MLDLPWNTAGRAIDPTLIVDHEGARSRRDVRRDESREAPPHPPGTLHCFFVGSAKVRRAGGGGSGWKRTNLLGHATTMDAKMEMWHVRTFDRPLLGVSERAPDGVENVAVFRHANG